MSHFVPPPDFRELLEQAAVRALRAAAAGVETHLVGGVLRDWVLGLPCHDYDAVVASGGLGIAQRLAESLPARLVLLGGKEFAAYRLVGAEDSIDLWDREGTPFEEDLARRDFTVNALALDATSGELIDRFGGLDDLRQRVLRAVTSVSFSGDPLRVLRLARLSVKLPGFSPAPSTLDLARASAPALVTVAAERVREELGHLFAHAEAAFGLALLHDLDLYPGLWLGTPGVPGEAAGAVVELETLTACARRWHQALAGVAGRPSERASDDVSRNFLLPDLRLARLAATFRHLPAGVSAEERLERFRDAGYLSPREAQAVRQLLEERELAKGRVGQRRFFHRLGALWSTGAVALAAREGAAGSGESALRWLDDLAQRAVHEAGEAIAPPRLVTGGDLKEIFGMAPGPRVGELLRAVLAAQVDGALTTRDGALELVRNRLAGEVRSEIE